MGRNADNSTDLTDFEKALIWNGIHDLIAKGATEDKKLKTKIQDTIVNKLGMNRKTQDNFKI